MQKEQTKQINQRLIDDEECGETKQGLHEGEQPYVEASWFSRLTFAWTSDYVKVRSFSLFIQFANTNKVHIDNLGDLHAEKSAQVATSSLEKNFAKFEEQGAMGLVKAVLLTFKCNLILSDVI